MADFAAQYALWNEFLKKWPLDRLATMSLDEYTQAGSQDSFTYWIESRLDQMGSIWGGSSFKFGVFSRADAVEKTSDRKLSYSDTHGWYSSLGSSAEEAFGKVRDSIVTVATHAAKGDLQAIERFTKLGEAYKWKIAFHYQNRRQASIVAIFKKAPLALFVGLPGKSTMGKLQRAAIEKMPEEAQILEFSREIWTAWSQKNLEIYKLSHGTSPFTQAERQEYLNRRLAVVHRDTANNQGSQYMSVPVGTLFYLCHGNSPRRIGQFTSDPVPCDKGEGWFQRSYRLLKPAKRSDRYQDNAKKWSPKGNSTFWQVGKNDLPDFERTLLEPYFGTTLAELAALAGTTLEADDGTPSSTLEAEAAMPEAQASGPPINRIYYGPPGTGKTRELLNLLKKEYEMIGENGVERRYRFVTFHQSYGYEEFVEGLRPRLIEVQDVEEGKDSAAAVGYEIRPGVFKELCRQARRQPHRRFALVIDEINRGNISKIFGELITLLEPDKREGALHAISLVLPYSGENFSVPANIDVFGTMNSADRSLALLDTALRRRFDFVPMMPDTRDEPDAPLHQLRVTIGKTTLEIPRMLDAINRRIEALYDKDHTIGHAYFTGLFDVPDGEARFDALRHLFRNRILPLLEEYFFDDWHKMRLILADSSKTEAYRFVTVRRDHDEELTELFGSDHGLDSYATRRSYVIQEGAFERPEAYLGIYQPV